MNATKAPSSSQRKSGTSERKRRFVANPADIDQSPAEKRALRERKGLSETKTRPTGKVSVSEDVYSTAAAPTTLRRYRIPKRYGGSSEPNSDHEVSPLVDDGLQTADDFRPWLTQTPPRTSPAVEESVPSAEVKPTAVALPELVLKYLRQTHDSPPSGSSSSNASSPAQIVEQDSGKDTSTERRVPEYFTEEYLARQNGSCRPPSPLQSASTPPQFWSAISQTRQTQYTPEAAEHITEAPKVTNDRRKCDRRPNGPRRVLCKWFRAGHCRFGESCTFLHPGIHGPLY